MITPHIQDAPPYRGLCHWWGVLGFPPPTFRGRVEGTNLYWAPGMECRREPWCVTKIAKTTLQVLKSSKLSEVTLKTIDRMRRRTEPTSTSGAATAARRLGRQPDSLAALRRQYPIPTTTPSLTSWIKTRAPVRHQPDSALALS